MAPDPIRCALEGKYILPTQKVHFPNIGHGNNLLHLAKEDFSCFFAVERCRIRICWSGPITGERYDSPLVEQDISRVGTSNSVMQNGLDPNRTESSTPRSIQ